MRCRDATLPLEEISESAAVSLGPLIENHPIFPNRINVQLMRIVSSGEIEIRIWERGAGYTLASGSSSCAAACAARRLGMVGDVVTVQMPGGSLKIEISAEWDIRMTGLVAGVAKGELLADAVDRIR